MEKPGGARLLHQLLVSTIGFISVRSTIEFSENLGDLVEFVFANLSNKKPPVQNAKGGR